ncbi:lipocalin family protein [Bacillus thuringiensis]|uniref:lipocalin family protein n=1 Tax=Bacillus thuringiensis TaxID=1428 RepID=UPI000E4C369C|nr:lipocalin family protein [Bacillus thuringiensis]MDZ3952351.1 lipocalin family protein [Bacillus thuringiensis]RGP45186.1 hypothetical protein BTW32_25745 [Bacillus thuringiensis]
MKSPLITLPQDTGPHAFSNVEWWYYFAFVKGDQGNEYSIMAAFFRVGELEFFKGHYFISSLCDLHQQTQKDQSVIDSKLVANMVTIYLPLYLLFRPTDIATWKLYGKLFLHQLPFPHLWMEHTPIQTNPTQLIFGNTSLTFKNDTTHQFHVHIQDKQKEWDLDFTPIKPISLIGQDGKPDELYYYSFTNNEVKGTIKNGENLETVTGKGWFDHQWGRSSKFAQRIGWNWFGIQLDDNRELLISENRSMETGATSSQMANFIQQDGTLSFSRNVYIHPISFWKSPQTNITYPVEWNISIPDFAIELTVKALFQEQEILILGPLRAIWEGACIVNGIETSSNTIKNNISGKGFAELVGYANL